ncbi:MAG: 4-hydroxy-tetrahydrodipicolinate reductase [Clostridiales bacterium]|nr:4-hydroxy-tetrahydrodipicolinate reductase [Clostridiales bacterium]
MVKVVITAPRGNMDKLIVQEAWKRDDMKIVGGVGTPGRDYIGKDIGMAAGMGREIGALVYDDIEKIIDECDMVLDFSTVELSMKVLKSCLAHNKALICGTTGFDGEQTKRLFAAGEKIPVMKAASTSYVMMVMKRILGEAAAMLGEKCTIEIIDMHSETKVDAPSGTAIELAEEMAEASRDKDFEDITFHSVRAGNTPSTHRVIFGGMGEKMEISHDAYDWRCYALGACDGAAFMADKGPGLYAMEDLLK